MQPFQGSSGITATIDRGDPDNYRRNTGSGGWRELGEDFLPLMALLGAVFGWVFALLVALVAAVVLLVS